MTTEKKFVKVATLDQIPPGERFFVNFDYETVVIFNLDGRLCAIADVCTHDGGPVGEGELEGCQIICPRHGARFDVCTGAVLSLPAVTPVPTYAVRVEGNDVYLEAPEDDW